ncbi:3',5'-cyclic-AMP phosphodiesterase [Acinetobacter qingfengensis]|uniref:Calcineurin-like phosphoesterase domain-containing protein n=1 Tax=Acinetobacter qingfengensis TaxID=1262585 RepID=A0A1E7R515_9GAMM|nr:3',5'-cyclic-AMP phosphodiesterase [Acinetobacter qingfengensis]KAA8732407.1 3',5'-cyclic-AMP phosphodiesterase [Acinetobacter qingfengensis]OEY94401.1 hypothetical protein BJI46_03405 [Acinetobacter qingfengensis]
MAKHLSKSHTSLAQQPIRILQISDAHLLNDKQGIFIGVNPYLSLQHVLRDAQQYAPYDCILSTGDLTQEPSPRSYQIYLDEVAQFNTPHIFIRGNHDDNQAFPETYDTENPDIQTIIIDHWCLILLNSQTLEGSHGYLKAETLHQLQEVLTQYHEYHTLIAMHHHSLPVGCAWLDQQNLRNAAEFLQCIHANPQIKAVINGHVHQATEQTISGVAFMSCPSTCVQFSPHSQDFSLDIQPPGYRILELYSDGKIITKINRINKILGEIDHQLTHY